MPEQPWWNDGDKVAGLAATVVMIAVAGLILTLVMKLCIWLITGEWTI